MIIVTGEIFMIIVTGVTIFMIILTGEIFDDHSNR